MRGKLAEKYIPALLRRITPADAGKTFNPESVGGLEEDHPRGCGENWILNNACGMDDGITPADAGKTNTVSINRNIIRDHPRGCGENFMTFAKLRRKPGSPPRMRGKPQKAACKDISQRITPADAGKTL